MEPAPWQGGFKKKQRALGMRSRGKQDYFKGNKKHPVFSCFEIAKKMGRVKESLEEK